MQSPLGDDVQGASNLPSYHPNMLKTPSLDMKEERWSEFGRSKWLSSSNDFHITIPSLDIQTREPTSIFESHSRDVVEGSNNLPSPPKRGSNWRLASTQNEISRACADKRCGLATVNSLQRYFDEDRSPERAPKNLDSQQKEKLLEFAIKRRQWNEVSSIYENFPDSVSITLNDKEDTSLHVAVRENNKIAVEKLLDLNHMTPEVLRIKNNYGNTAFFIAAMLGHYNLIEMMAARCEKLATIPGIRGNLPVHEAAFKRHSKVVDYLSRDHLLKDMAMIDIEKLFFKAIRSGIYDVASKLVEKYPKLAVARDKYPVPVGQTALHLLVQIPSEQFGKLEDNDLKKRRGEDNDEGTPTRVRPIDLFKQLWSEVNDNHILDLLIRPSVVLFDAVESEKVDVVELLLKDNDKLLDTKDPTNGHNILHVAVLYRQHNIFKFILQKRTEIISDTDYRGNSILHYAAYECRQEDPLLGLRPGIQMQQELKWFKEVEMQCPELRLIKNNKGQTPIQVFYDSHKTLYKEVKKQAKGIATSGMVVATVIASIAFAAALAVPTDKSKVAATIAFMLINAIALITSSTSIVSFLSIFASPESPKGAYVTSLYPTLVLNLGLSLLFISIAAMLTAFATASFLILDDKYKWVAYVMTSLGFFPIVILRMLEFRLWSGLRDYFVWYAKNKISKSQVWIFFKSIACRVKCLCNN